MTDILMQMHACAESTDRHVGELFEAAVQKTYEAFLTPGDYAIDIGAHKGAHLFPMANAVGSSGRVIGFEPIEPLYNKLNKQVRSRGLKQVRLHNVAIGLHKGPVEFSYFTKKPAYSGLQTRPTPFSSEEGGLVNITVEGKQLDQFRPFFRKINYIKLDIEGGELNALQSGQRLLEKSRPLIVFENGKMQTAKTYNYAKEDFFGFFDQLEYKLFVITGGAFTPADWTKHIRCWEFVALPVEDCEFAEKLPLLAQQVLAEV